MIAELSMLHACVGGRHRVAAGVAMRRSDSSRYCSLHVRGGTCSISPRSSKTGRNFTNVREIALLTDQMAADSSAQQQSRRHSLQIIVRH